jgi:hypothetical protein
LVLIALVVDRRFVEIETDHSVSDLFELEKRRSVERKAGGTVDV